MKTISRSLQLVLYVYDALDTNFYGPDFWYTHITKCSEFMDTLYVIGLCGVTTNKWLKVGQQRSQTPNGIVNRSLHESPTNGGSFNYIHTKIMNNPIFIANLATD